MADKQYLDNKTKPWDAVRPFHRINSPNYDPDHRHVPDGHAYRCGARHPASDYVASETERAAVGALIGLIVGLAAYVPELDQEEANNLRVSLSEWILENTTGLIFRPFLRHVPAWVPVGRNRWDPNYREEMREIEGKLTRSFQGALGIPFYQWKHYYTWNFHVQPDYLGRAETVSSGPARNGFSWIVGKGNRIAEDELVGRDLGTDEMAPALDMADRSDEQNNSLECIMDIGAFGNTPADYFAGQSGPPLEETHGMPQGPMYMREWPFWPQAGDWFWAQGRHVYDCRHIVEEEGYDPTTGKPFDRMWTQLNPVQAFATYRYEGFKFKRNKKAVPAARFQFFTCQRAGYHDFEPYSSFTEENDLEFIVDLPDLPEDYWFLKQILTWHIHEYEDVTDDPDDPVYRGQRINTGSLRSPLLIEVTRAPYTADDAEIEKYFNPGILFDTQLEPQIEPIASDDHMLPRQVRIKIPVSKIGAGQMGTIGGTGADADKKFAFGFVVSMGWYDPDEQLAQLVKVVRVKLMKILNLEDRGWDEILRFRYGINGRMIYLPLEEDEITDEVTFPDSGGTPDHIVNDSATLLLPVDEKVCIHAAPMERNGFGEHFENKVVKDRRLYRGGLIPIEAEWLNNLVLNESIIEQLLAQGVIDEEEAQRLRYLQDLARTIVGGTSDITWKEHIDQEDNETASHIARKLWFAQLLIAHNKQLGLLDRDIGGLHQSYNTCWFYTGGDDLIQYLYEGHTVETLIGDDPKAEATRDITISPRRMELVGSHRMLWYQYQEDAEHSEQDYSIEIKVEVRNQPDT